MIEIWGWQNPHVTSRSGVYTCLCDLKNIVDQYIANELLKKHCNTWSSSKKCKLHNHPQAYIRLLDWKQYIITCHPWSIGWLIHLIKKQLYIETIYYCNSKSHQPHSGKRMGRDNRFKKGIRCVCLRLRSHQLRPVHLHDTREDFTNYNFRQRRTKRWIEDVLKQHSMYLQETPFVLLFDQCKKCHLKPSHRPIIYLFVTDIDHVRWPYMGKPLH